MHTCNILTTIKIIVVMNKKYYLYCLCDPNEKIPRYIGITCDPKRRFKHHLKDNSTTPKTKWIKSLLDNSQRPILVIAKETEEVKQVIEWEIKAIAKYKEIYKLTNSTAGGEYDKEGTPVKEFDLDGNFIDSYNSMIEYCELHDWNPNRVAAISSSCLRKRNYCYNRIFRYLDDDVTEQDLIKLREEYHRRDPKHFIIVSPDGKLLGEFNSFQEAERSGFGSQGCISRSLREIPGCASVKGNLICYNMEDYPNKLHIYRISKAKGKDTVISKYDLDGNYIETYYSKTDAVNSLEKSSRNGLKKCLEEEKGQFGGFQWRYGDNKENIGKYQKPSNRGKEINQYSLQGEFIKKWNSVRSASLELKIDAVGIRKCADGIYKKSGGFIWKY